jgi:hypothetical protein
MLAYQLDLQNKSYLKMLKSMLWKRTGMTAQQFEEAKKNEDKYLKLKKYKNIYCTIF